MEFINADEKRTWREYCAVVELPIQQFMDIQNALLLEQLDVVANNRWFTQFVGTRPPRTIEEYRRVVPLHTWKSYVGALEPESLNGLGTDAHCLVQTSWTHGSWKKVPWVRRFFDAQCRHAIAAMMMSVARHQGDVRVNQDFRVLPVIPDAPFASAWLQTGVIERNVVSSRLAPRESDGDLTMPQKIQAGLMRSLEPGVDSVIGMASSLLLARREFDKMMTNASFGRMLREAGPIAALKWAFKKLRPGRSRPWEPKSLLAPKSIITWGADTARLAPALEDQWGAPVLQMYASSEAGIIAMQDWRRDGLIPLPASVFLEFLPDGIDGEGKSTVLINELEEGRLYEPVITSFYGMPFTRMRQGDLLRVIGHNEHGLQPLELHERADDIIDLGSIARIDTATLTEALEIVGFRERDWSASKEYEGDRPILHVHVNADPERVPELRRKIHRALGVVDPHYREACYTMGARLLRVTAAKSDVVTAPAPTFEVDENAVTADETPVAAHRSGGA